MQKKLLHPIIIILIALATAIALDSILQPSPGETSASNASIAATH